MRSSRILWGSTLAALVVGPLHSQVRLKPVDGFTLARLKGQKDSRVKTHLDRAVSSLLQHSPQPTRHSFRARSIDVDQFGRTVARYDHYWDGLRIAGEDSTAVLDPEDRVEEVRHAFKVPLEPPDEMTCPRISSNTAEEKAQAILEAKHGGGRAGIRKGWQELVLEPQIERVPIQRASLWAPATGASDPTSSVRVLKG